MFSLLLSNNTVKAAAIFTYFDCEISSSTTPSWQQVGKVGLALGAVGLATYGAAKIGGWLWGQTDETCIKKAQKACKQAAANFANMSSILQSQLPHNSFDVTNMEVSEEILYQMATAKYHDAPISSYISKLKTCINELEDYLKSIIKRKDALRMNISRDYQATKLYNKMSTVQMQLEAILPPLQLTYQCLKTHESFFALFELEDVLAYRYERDLHAVQVNKQDSRYLREMIHQSVMLQQATHHGLYPYHWYLHNLQDDITFLSRAINSLDFNYVNRRNVATALYDNLLVIQQTIVASPYYAQEIRAMEHAQLISASIAAQEHQTQELAHQNAIAEQQLIMQRQNPRTHHYIIDDTL